MIEPPAWLFFGIVIGWGLFEVGMGVFRRSRGPKVEKRDAQSFRIIWITIGLGNAAGIYLGLRGVGHLPAVHPLATWIGLGLIVAGLVLRGVAIRTLSRFFTVDVAVHADHRVIRSGVYRFMRHPSYSGSLLSFLGLGIALESWVSVLVVTLPVCAAFYWRIRVEEKALLEGLGEAYAEYCRQTKRLIPFVF